LYTELFTIGSVQTNYSHLGQEGGGLVGISSDTRIENSYSKVKINAWYDGGNLTGTYKDSIFVKCFYDSGLNPTLLGKGVVSDPNISGCTPDELSDANTFINSGWDFAGETTNGSGDIWEMPPGGTPVFSWQESTTVPNISNLDVNSAKGVLNTAGLFCIQTRVYSDAVAAGCILKQEPIPGTLSTKGMPVYATVSAGPCPYSGGGSGSPEFPCRITNAADLNLLRNKAEDYALSFELVSDVNLGGAMYSGGVIAPQIDELTPPFTGTFNGNNHTVRNFNARQSSAVYLPYLGLFERVGCGGRVCNLIITDANFSGTCYAAANGTVAGILGLGVIENCKVYGKIATGEIPFGGIVGSNNNGIIRNCLVTGTFSATDNVGGIAAENYGIIRECGVNATQLNSKIWGGSIGGIACYNSQTIENCYASGNLNGYSSTCGGIAGSSNYDGSINFSSIINCYAACTVTGYGSVSQSGGLVGYESGAGQVYPGCTWDKSLFTGPGIGNNSGSPIAGKTTAEMKTKATFTSLGWGFAGETGNSANDYWRMCVDKIDYPRLNWEFIKNGDFSCPDGVDMSDLVRLCQDWLMTYSQSLSGADANGDSQVNLADFAILAGNWLKN
jgi:hypothetical protein